MSEHAPAKSDLTERLAKCIAAVRYDALPAAAVDMAKQVLLDGIAVILAGRMEPSGLADITLRYLEEIGGKEQATVIGGGVKTSMPNAAYANGTFGHALDFDNIAYPNHHPNSPTIPAILAVAEGRGLSGKSVIEGIVVAFEVQSRIRVATIGWGVGTGFHKPGITGTMGATAAAARMLGLDVERTVMALGAAGSRAGSLALNSGTMTKASHSGHGARMGVECALLASMGWTAAREIFFGDGAFFDLFTEGEVDPELLVTNFGHPFRMVEPGVGFKKHPCNYFTHRAVDAALALHHEQGVRKEQVESVEVLFPPFEYVNRPKPASGLDGKFSVQYVTAAALLDGELTIESFTDERRFAADMEELLARTKFIGDTSIPRDFDATYAEVIVHQRDGATLRKRVKELSGWVGFPLTREQRLNKFFGCARGILDRRTAERVLGFVDQLEALADIREMMDLLRAAPRAGG